MKKSLSTWLISPVANTAIGFISLFTSMLIARNLEPVQRGYIAEALLWPTFVLTIGGVISMQSIVFFWSKAKKDGTIAKVMGVSLFLTITLSLLLSGVSFGVDYLILGIQNKPSFPAALIYSCILPAILLSSFLNSAFLADEKPLRFWGFRLSSSVLYLAGLILLAYFRKITVINAVSVLVFSNWLPLIPMIFVFVRAYPIRPQWQSSLLTSIISYGFKTNLAGLPTQLNIRADQAMMSLILPIQVLGFYSVAYSWSSSLYFVGSGLSVAMLARSSASDAFNTVHLKQLFSRFRMLSIFLLGLGILAALATPVLVPFIFGTLYTPSVPPAVILCIASIVLSSNIVLHELIRGLGYPELGIYAEISGLVLNIGLLALMLQRLEGIGAAIASLLSYSMVTVILLVLLSKKVNTSVFQIVIPQVSDFVQVRDMAATLMTRLQSLHLIQHNPRDARNKEKTWPQK